MQKPHRSGRVRPRTPAQEIRRIRLHGENYRKKTAASRVQAGERGGPRSTNRCLWHLAAAVAGRFTCRRRGQLHTTLAASSREAGLAGDASTSSSLPRHAGHGIPICTAAHNRRGCRRTTRASRSSNRSSSSELRAARFARQVRMPEDHARYVRAAASSMARRQDLGHMAEVLRAAFKRRAKRCEGSSHWQAR